MAIRIRVIDGCTVALCAARSVAKEDDIYLDDAAHAALADKFARDWSGTISDDDLPGVMRDVSNPIVEREESDNANRDAWDRQAARWEQEGEIIKSVIARYKTPGSMEGWDIQGAYWTSEKLHDLITQMLGEWDFATCSVKDS